MRGLDGVRVHGDVLRGGEGDVEEEERGELSRIQATGAQQIVAAPTGVSICAALSVNAARTEENFGDFALSGDTIVGTYSLGTSFVGNPGTNGFVYSQNAPLTGAAVTLTK